MRGGGRKPGKTRKPAVASSRKWKKIDLPRAGAARLAGASGSRRGITEHTLSSFRRRARARAPPRGPKRGRPEYFYYYYYFITILLSLKFAAALTPEKKYTHGTLHPKYSNINQPHAARLLQISNRRETPSLRTTVTAQTQILRRLRSGVRVVIIIIIIIILHTIMCTYISRTARR